MFEDDTLSSTGHLTNYAICMLYLQEKGNLSYKEARAVLSSYRGDIIWDLAELYGTTVNAVMNQERRGLRKMKAAGIDLTDLLHEFPMDFIQTNPILKEK